MPPTSRRWFTNRWKSVTEDLIASFEFELADRLAWRDWSELEEKFGSEFLSDFDAGIEPKLVAASGLIIYNEVSVYSMNTAYGDYPYPREMRHGVWSATKSLTGLVTLLRMAQKYGDEILDYKVRDYFHVTADHDGYDSVTLRHALSMATRTGTENVDPNNISDGYIYSDFEAYKAWYLAPPLAKSSTTHSRYKTIPGARESMHAIATGISYCWPRHWTAFIGRRKATTRICGR